MASDVQLVQVAGIELFVVGDEEFLGDGHAEFRIQHLLEVGGRVHDPPIEQAAQAVDELLLVQLADVELKGVVHIAAAVEDKGALVVVHFVPALEERGEPAPELLLAEMKKVARVVPDELPRVKGPAISPRFTLLFQDEIGARL